MKTHGSLLLHLWILILGLAFLAPGIAGAQLALPDIELWTNVGPGEPAIGSAVAAGDFNGDGFTDMAAGAPFDDGFFSDSGRVYLRLTTASGVSEFSTNSCLNGADQGQDYHLGAALAFGDFDGDGDDDLAVGMPGATSNGALDAGAVCVFYGNPGGLDAEPRSRFSQDLLEIGHATPGDLFGFALAAGDLNGDEYEDLAIGAPGEEILNAENSGLVHVLFGGPTGLTIEGNRPISRAHEGNDYTWVAEEDEFFSSTLAIGDFWGDDSLNELAIGAPGDNSEGIGGSVTIVNIDWVIPLWRNHIHVGGDWDLLGTGEAGDRFGGALAPGDFNGDGRTDLAVGLPGETGAGPVADAGSVMVLYRDEMELSDVGEQVFFENLFPAEVQAFDQFGQVLAAGDFDSDGKSDLAIGSPLDNPLAFGDAGKVTVIYGSDTGLQSSDFQLVAMSFFGGLQSSDRFGAALATGKFFDQSGGDDLLIGVPGRNVDGETDVGLTVVLQSALFFADGFESGDLTAWSP